MFKKKPTASEIDGVQYRRAKLWQIICCSCNALLGLTVYSLIGMASYSASIGYGITTAVVGVILTGSRIIDAITDPMVAFIYDRVNTRFGKIRILLWVGYFIEALALWLMFDGMSSKGFGLATFTLLYLLYVVGYTINNMTVQTINPILTNDPKQRPTVGVWSVGFNYLVPTVFSIVLNVVLLPICGGTYNQTFLSSAVRIVLVVGAIGNLLTTIGISAYDKPETFEGTSQHEPLNLKRMFDILKGNKPLQSYIAAAASDKIAQQVGSQAIINTLFNGIVIGNMGIATILTVISMIPSLFFAAFGAKYVGKHGSKKGIVTWTYVSMTITAVLVLFFIFTDPKQIGTMGSWNMIVYVLLTILQNGSNMCVSTCNTSFMADTIDYELDRSGQYVPSVVTSTYSLIDKLITSFSAVIATGAVAMIGYTHTVPQPTDPSTPAIFWLALAMKYGLPIIGWVITLCAMRGCDMTREKMVEVQKRIAEKKAVLRHQVIEENMK